MKNKQLSLLGISVLSMAVSQAIADERWYVSPMLSTVITDADRKTDDDLGLHLGFGTPVSDNWNIEFGFVMDKLEQTSGSNSFDQKGIIIDGLYIFNRKAESPVYTQST